MADSKKPPLEWNPADFVSGLGGRIGGEQECRSSILRNIDARVLLPAAFVLILALTTAKQWYVPGAVFVVVFFVTIYAAPSRQSYIKLLLYPLTVALFILVVQAFTFGSTVVATIIWPIYAQGITSGWLLCVRVLASVSILLLLMESKSQIELIEALAWFKIPVEIRELMSLMFRYVSVLAEEFTTMFNAQKSRLGYSAKLGWIKKIKHLALIGEKLLVRSYDRSYRVTMSMLARGYSQNADIVRNFAPFKKKDYLFAVFALALIVGVMLVGVM